MSLQNKVPIVLRSLATLTFSGIMAVIAAAPSVAAPITFAQYIETDGHQDWTIKTTPSGGGSLTNIQGDGQVFFSFLGVGAPFGGAPQLANFSLTANSNSIGNCGVSCGSGDGYLEAGFSGSFSFTEASAGALFGQNLLSGTFAVVGSPTTTGAKFTSTVGAGSASFTASSTIASPSELIFTSAFENFSPATIQEVASFSLSSLIADFAVGTVTANQAYPAAGPFTAAGSGTFSSNPAPTTTPEPATLALVGGGLMGLGLLRRKAVRGIDSKRVS